MGARFSETLPMRLGSVQAGVGSTSHQHWLLRSILLLIGGVTFSIGVALVCALWSPPVLRFTEGMSPRLRANVPAKWNLTVAPTDRILWRSCEEHGIGVTVETLIQENITPCGGWPSGFGVLAVEAGWPWRSLRTHAVF